MPNKTIMIWEAIIIAHAWIVVILQTIWNKRKSYYIRKLENRIYDLEHPIEEFE